MSDSHFSISRLLVALALGWSAACTSTSFASEAHALRFDGVDDSVDFGTGPVFDAHTLEVWVRPPAVPVPGFGGIIFGQIGSDPVTGCVTGSEFFLDGPRLGYEVGIFGCRNGTSIRSAATPGVWHHLAGTYDGATMRLYMDGVLVGTRTGVAFDPYDHMLAGALWNAQGGHNAPIDFFPGDLWEIRLWDHARTECEIREAMCATLVGSEPGLIGYWLLNEGSGQTVVDSSPVGFDGRLGLDPGPDAGDPGWVSSEDPTPCLGPCNLPPDTSLACVTPDRLWPPNHQLVGLAIGCVTDPEGDPITITVTAITQDEPTTGLGSGDQSPDGVLDPLQVRAERAGTGDGRVYRIAFVASDGNAATPGSVQVCVPMTVNSTCVDSLPPEFDSTLR